MLGSWMIRHHPELQQLTYSLSLHEPGPFLSLFMGKSKPTEDLMKQVKESINNVVNRIKNIK